MLRTLASSQARAWVFPARRLTTGYARPPVRGFPIITWAWHNASTGLPRCAQDSVGIMLMETTQGCPRDVRRASCRCYV